MNIEINGVMLDGDLMDADFIDRFEAALKKMGAEAARRKNLPYTSAGAVYRSQCEVINTCLDEIFGDGTADAVFHGTMNMMEHMQAIEQISQWSQESRKQFNDYTNKYVQRSQVQPFRPASPYHGKRRKK